jgi:hypothetical protein
MDKKDLFAFFLNLFKNENSHKDDAANKADARIDQIIEEFEITKLDIQRMQRYLDKCTYPSEVLHEDGGEEDGGDAD